MRYSVQPVFSRAVALLGLLGLGLAQVGCAHPVVVEPSVSVHSRIGHFPVYAQIGVPGPVIYAPPPHVVFVPRVYAPMDGWGYREDRRERGHDRRHWLREDGSHGRGGWGRGDDRHR